MSTRRDSYALGMPQLLMHGLSERWLIKECGDLHWRMVCDDLSVASGALTDHEGARLYATFLRVRLLSRSGLAAFAENDTIELEANLARFGDKRFLSEFSVRGASDLSVNMVTVFVTRETDNKSLSRATPEHLARSTAFVHEAMPEFASGYSRIKAAAVDPANPASSGPNLTLAGVDFVRAPRALGETRHLVCPYTDLNGVGLLYFASYPRINDICERRVISALPSAARERDWALCTTLLARDVYYYGNVDVGDSLQYRLHDVALDSQGRIGLWSTLTRADSTPIADVFTVKRVDGDASAFAEALAELTGLEPRGDT